MTITCSLNGIEYFHVEFLADKTNVLPSRGEAKKMVIAGGISINKNKINEMINKIKILCY